MPTPTTPRTWLKCSCYYRVLLIMWVAVIVILATSPLDANPFATPASTAPVLTGNSTLDDGHWYNHLKTNKQFLNFFFVLLTFAFSFCLMSYCFMKCRFKRNSRSEGQHGASTQTLLI